MKAIATYVEGCTSIRTTQGAGGHLCFIYKDPDSPAAVSTSQASSNNPAAGGLEVAEAIEANETKGVERSEALEWNAADRAKLL